MKKILVVLITMFTSTLFAQEAERAMANCSCKPEQTVCSAEGVFMSCCFCCQSGASCGAWQAFGLVGCRCDMISKESNSMNNIHPVKFYFEKFEDFLNLLDHNKVEIGELRILVSELLIEKVSQIDEKGSSYYKLEGEGLRDFTDKYLEAMKIIIKNENNNLIVSKFFEESEIKK